MLRFTVTSTYTTTEDILKDWNEIRIVTEDIQAKNSMYMVDRVRVPLKGNYKGPLLYTFSCSVFNVYLNS